MVSLYFGLPGCGKTTLLAKKAYIAVKQGKYEHVYSNVELKIPGVTYIDDDCIGKYALERCIIFIDEATLFADSRDFKKFSAGRKHYFMKHRHYKADIVLFTQRWDAVDLKIRTITDKVYYVYKGFWTGSWLSSYYRIPYGIIIPDPKKDGNGAKLGEIIQGYCKPNFLIRLFAGRVFRPRWYKYFDSWELNDKLPPLPDTYQPYALPDARQG